MSNTFPSRPHHPHHPHFPPPPSYGDPYKPPAPFQPQYIGARYVPVFANPVEWSDQNYYENLTMVMQNGDTYISRVPVPVGTPLDDTKFWLKIGPFSEQLAALTNLIEGWDAKIADNTATAEEAERVANEALKLVQDATGDYTLIKTTVEQHTAQLEALQKQADETQSLAQQNADEIASINQEVTDNKNAITTNAAKIAALEPRVTANENGIAANKAAIEALQTGTADLSQIRQDIADNKQAIGANELAISDMRSDITAQDTKIAAANTSIAQNAKDISDLTAAIGTDETPDTIKGRIKALEESEIPTADLDKLKADVAGNTAAIDGLNASQSAQDAKITTNENAITALQTRATDHDQELEKLNSSLQEVSDNVVKNTETLTGLTDDIASVQQAAEDAQEAAKTATEAAASATEVTEGLKDAVDANTAAIAELPGKYLPLTAGSTSPITSALYVNRGAPTTNSVASVVVKTTDEGYNTASLDRSSGGFAIGIRKDGTKHAAENTVTLSGIKTPVNEYEAANKAYVDAAVAGAGVPTDITDRLAAVETTVGDAQSGLVKDVDDLQTTVGGIPDSYLPLTAGTGKPLTGSLAIDRTLGTNHTNFLSMRPKGTTDNDFVVSLFKSTGAGSPYVQVGLAPESAAAMNAPIVRGIAAPTKNFDAANKKYVDDAIAAAGVPADIASRLEAVEKDSTENMGDISALQADVAEINGQQSAQDTAISGNTTAINNAVNRIAAVEQGYLPLTGGTITGAISSAEDSVNILKNSPGKYFLFHKDPDTNVHSLIQWDDEGNFPEDYSCRVAGIASPTHGTDAANKNYVDTTAELYLPRSGGTMTGTIYRHRGTYSSALVSVPAATPSQISPTLEADNTLNIYATELGYEGAENTWVRVTNIADPMLPSGVANKRYVDSKAGVQIITGEGIASDRFHMVGNLTKAAQLNAFPENTTQFSGFGQTTLYIDEDLKNSVQIAHCTVRLKANVTTPLALIGCLVTVDENVSLSQVTFRDCYVFSDTNKTLTVTTFMMAINSQFYSQLTCNGQFNGFGSVFQNAALGIGSNSDVLSCGGGTYYVQNGAKPKNLSVHDAEIVFNSNSSLENSKLHNCTVTIYSGLTVNISGTQLTNCRFNPTGTVSVNFTNSSLNNCNQYDNSNRINMSVAGNCYFGYCGMSGTSIRGTSGVANNVWAYFNFFSGTTDTTNIELYSGYGNNRSGLNT